ncbi:GPI-anchor transamidase [Willisornis vidua]|uniref:GPI-anchor transamidase n=1 Tax=Willisornis vidua TaxID=1566151 RepID=A0ABQ9D0X7_9PASS|nr:GPI-anchor transamidase [Willisornis vidua]
MAALPGVSRARAAAAALLLGCCGAVLAGGVQVCTSRFWFNYRHVANTLSVYRSVKRLGIPDSHIVLMLADDMACNPRNPKPATVFSHKNMELNVYGDDVEVDYRSYEVTVENFLRVLTGRIPPSTPRSKRLLSDDRSNILIYMTGHGGNGFLKFQDSEEITNVELADAFEQMWQKRRYNELLFIIDTCQGASMYERFYSPNIMALASSQVGEDSLSHQPDLGIGVHLMDRYTFYVLEFLEEIHPASQTNMNDLRDPQNVLITDFFGSVRKVEITTETVSLDRDLAGLESKVGFENVLYVKNMTKSLPNTCGNIASSPRNGTLGQLITKHCSSVWNGKGHLDIKISERSSTGQQFLVASSSFDFFLEGLAGQRVVLVRFPEDELATEPLKYAEQLPVAQIIHQIPVEQLM